MNRRRSIVLTIYGSRCREIMAHTAASTHRRAGAVGNWSWTFIAARPLRQGLEWQPRFLRSFRVRKSGKKEWFQARRSSAKSPDQSAFIALARPFSGTLADESATGFLNWFRNAKVKRQYVSVMISKSRLKPFRTCMRLGPSLTKRPGRRWDAPIQDRVAG